MEKYIRHGLTKWQDRILGAFGRKDIETDIVHPDMLQYDSRNPAEVTKIKEAFKQLVEKGYLDAIHDEHDNIVYRLTLAGKKLWKIRAKEEEEGPNG